MKRASSSLASTSRTSFSEAALRELEALRNLNLFRARVSEFGIMTKYQKSNGKWGHRSRASILDYLRSGLEDIPGMFRRDILRAYAGFLGVKKYTASGGTGQTSWRKCADLAADCNAATALAKGLCLK